MSLPIEARANEGLGNEIIWTPRRVRVDIKPYNGEKFATFVVGKNRRKGRVDQVGPEEWIVGNDPECFNDTRFIWETAGMMADTLRSFEVDCILAPTTRALMTAFATASLLDHGQVAIARKSILPTPPKVMKEPMTSITSGREGELMIDGETENILRGKNVAAFDDVISRGDSMSALIKLAERAGANVTVVSAVGVEGAAPFDVFKKYVQEGRFVYLAVLPLFATGDTLNTLMAEKERVEAMFRTQ